MKRLILLALCVLVVVGCSSVKTMLPGRTDSPGDQMLTRAKQTKTLGKTWNDGQKMVERGEKLLSKSEMLAIESREAKVEADGLIARGRTLIEGSENNYRKSIASASNDSETR